jgi:WD40 repeat protein
MRAAWLRQLRDRLIYKDHTGTRGSTSHEPASPHLASPIQLHQMGMLQESKDEIFHLAFSPDGTLLAAATGGEICLWNVQQHQCIQRLSVPNRQIPQIAFSPDGTTIAAVDEEIRLWSWESDQTSRFAIPDLYATGVAFSPDGKFLATGDMTGKVLLLVPKEMLQPISGSSKSANTSIGRKDRRQQARHAVR